VEKLELMHTRKILRTLVFSSGAIAIALIASTMEAKAQLTVTPVRVTPVRVTPVNVNPPTVNPPTVNPPTVNPPTVNPPTVEPPVVEPPDTPPTNGGTATVPEPSATAGLLIMSALGGSLMWQRRKLHVKEVGSRE
jgi:hypothetical protein